MGPAEIGTFFIETLGCQMNMLDSELICDTLTRAGLHRTDRPSNADLAVLNTCSVRRHAEVKALSRVGHWEYLRRTTSRPAIIAMVGCFAQRDPGGIEAEAGFVDVICGPGRLHELPELVRDVRNGRAIVAVDDLGAIRTNKAKPADELERFDTCRAVEPGRFQSLQTYVRVQRGCDNFCSYCIVPYVRGRESSRAVSNILDEVARLDEAGVKEVTLLGQTISSYAGQYHGRTVGLADLLRLVHEKTSVPRIRFITSYPGDFPVDIFYAMAELDRVCPYLHLPAQHGSDRMLKRMNRRYTVEHYLELVDRGRQIVPGLSLAGDFIVGFPAETDDDHQGSLDLLAWSRYKNCFIFKYSPRPGTAAQRRYTDDIPDVTKTTRLQQLLELENKIASEDNRRLVGRTVSVLVEGRSRKARPDHASRQLMGRTVDGRIAVFDGPADLAGRILDVKVTRTSALTLFGERV